MSVKANPSTARHWSASKISETIGRFWTAQVARPGAGVVRCHRWRGLPGQGGAARCLGRESQAGVVREEPGLGAVGAAELVEHPRDVALDRGLGQVQAEGDLRVKQARAEAGPHLRFALR